jgi:hypothetical protein
MRLFVSYAGADTAWAEWIAWQLERAGHEAIVQAWDFRPGENFVVQMRRALDTAERTLAVMSTAYLEFGLRQRRVDRRVHRSRRPSRHSHAARPCLRDLAQRRRTRSPHTQAVAQALSDL